MKKWVLAACTVCFMFAVQLTAYAGSEAEEPHSTAACITKEEAKAAACEYIAEGSKFQFAEKKGDAFEVVYYNDSLQEYYQVNLDSHNREVLSYKSWLFRHKGSKNVVLSEEEAMQLVTDEYPDADNLAVNLNYKGDLKSYLVSFNADGMQGTFEINPESGQIIGRQMDME
ncbi:PepSY domain-containing protein [Clostridium sp. AM58-1XD]|uniref:PepSY domain-containing protein n=1 Tax=Clostridium sp. AM58-1XD TaxID=2292307 RepID=UPI000E46E9A4|nr:PepSY domain-containing protein [Clostridium sp. AM58-1XD]RGY98535.1 hypothetical protein DXA13_10570 [Clostridium sp. AM58-1XD]